MRGKRRKPASGGIFKFAPNKGDTNFLEAVSS